MLNHQAKRFPIYLTMLCLLLVCSIIISINAGYIHIPLNRVIATLTGNGLEQDEITIFSFRLPKIFMAMLVGMGMAVSGAIFQAITKNPLADPGILGINAGAGFAIVVYTFFIQGVIFSIEWLSIFFMPFVALVGALLAASLIYLLAWKKGNVTPTRMLLIGIGINSAFGAGITILQLKMEPINFMKTIVWLSGTIWGTSWTFIWVLLPWLLVLIPYTIYKSRVLDIMTLGDQVSISVGISLMRDRLRLLFIAVLLAGVCVAVGGGITFLGLIAPHIARRLVGATHYQIIPISALLGGLLLVVSDMIGRIIMAPTELPVGIILSIIGAPYFIYLMFMKK
ncbi:iron ABC transporter permease [Metasolibacillus sp. FSL K6-0083]|uniref:FecCD family ABC transporter permease n=1 Tax=Metasolibacillus sp. FSL K6-0083 TaxID=2921416 RepID=UPI003159AA5B